MERVLSSLTILRNKITFTNRNDSCFNISAKVVDIFLDVTEINSSVVTKVIYIINLTFLKFEQFIITVTM